MTELVTSPAGRAVPDDHPIRALASRWEALAADYEAARPASFH